jgi:deoxycytidine triphosphate deaminase
VHESEVESNNLPPLLGMDWHGGGGMPLLNKADIIRNINAGNLVLRALRNDATQEPIVEPASYDLRAGLVIWKNPGSASIEQSEFVETNDLWQQAVVTLSPGQMVFVITHEELKLPETVSATVYSRNKLQKENILALNAGHINPGYQGPIMIRLINLSSISWPLHLGSAIFTAVFHRSRTAKDLQGTRSERRLRPCKPP